MSGIAAAVSLTDEPLDAAYFQRWARSLEETGPHAGPRLHCERRACLAHAPLHAGPAAKLHSQPTTLDDRTWIVVDARLDARDDLRRELRGRDREVPGTASDAELILHAYAVWGAECVHHLLGDFAFALWDGNLGRLLAATDHFGVRPLYHASTAEGLVVSNWGAPLHGHRAVDRSPDDAALVRFLWHGQTAPGETAFAGIRVLLPASRLICERREVRIDRYWVPPVEEPLLRADETEYVEEFREMLKVAVSDRIRDAPVALLMSGGLDSPAIAVAAKALGRSESLTAHTVIYESLIPDDERGFAAAVADRLGIRIVFHPADDCRPFFRGEELALTDVIPENNPFVAQLDDQIRSAGSGSVILTGQGTDAILAPEALDRLARSRVSGQLRAVVRNTPRHFRAYGRRPPLGILPTLARLRGTGAQDPPPPPWLRTGFPPPDPVATVDDSVHPFRREAYRITAGNWIPAAVACYTRVARPRGLSCAHPFLDLRLVRFCLRLPPVPLCWDKHLLRMAVRGQLPPEVVVRPKTPLRTDVLGAAVRRLEPAWLPVQEPGPVTSRYYLWPDFVPLERLMTADPVWVHSRPVALELLARCWSQRPTIR